MTAELSIEPTPGTERRRLRRAWREAFAKLPQAFRGQTVKGIGFDRDTLRAAGVENCDAFAALRTMPPA